MRYDSHFGSIGALLARDFGVLGEIGAALGGSLRAFLRARGEARLVRPA